MNTWKYFYEKCHGNQRGTIPPKNKWGRKQRLEGTYSFEKNNMGFYTTKHPQISQRKNPKPSSRQTRQTMFWWFWSRLICQVLIRAQTLLPILLHLRVTQLWEFPWGQNLLTPKDSPIRHGLELATAGHPWGQHQKFLEFVHVNGWLMDKFVPGATHVFFECRQSRHPIMAQMHMVRSSTRGR